MPSLPLILVTARRFVRRSMGFGFLVISGLVLASGELLPAPTRDWAWVVIAAIAWCLLAYLRWRTPVRSRVSEPRPWSTSLERALLLLVLVVGVTQVTGGMESPLYPVMFVLAAGVGAFLEVVPTAAFLLVAVALDAFLWFVTEGQTRVEPFVLRTAFVVVFGLLNLLFTRAEIARFRSRSEKERQEERDRVRDDARLFRLLSSSSVTEPADDERLFRSSLNEVHSATFHVLDLLKNTLDLYTCILLFLDESGEQLRIVELASDADDLAEGPFRRGEGAVGAVVSRGVATNLEHLRPGYGGLCYYRDPSRVQAFVAIPVRDGPRLVGVLCCDRLDDRPFTPTDERVLSRAVHQVLRTLENERVFVQLERQKREQTVLYRASQNLGAATTEAAVIEAGHSAARDIARHDLCVMTRFDPRTSKHRITDARGAGAEALRGLTFKDNSSLTAMVVKNQHYLPYRGDFDPSQQVVFTKRTRLSEMQSLLVMPLVVREDTIGTMVLAAERKEAFGDSVRPTLQLLANQMAVALANAEAVHRLEQMATTDGLTGCLNKRAFLDELDRKLTSAARFGRNLALIVTDIDHFKAVNDTYGHATGDVVLRGLAAILERVKRETDIVARFGGEEFCVLCEETSEEGARRLAERIREEVEGRVFETELGKLEITTSLGVATFPSVASTASELFEAADKALYAAKHAGRNQVRSAASRRRPLPERRVHPAALR